MTKPDFQAEAESYVKETDYITNLNRNLAGNAFLAGAAVGYECGKDDERKEHAADKVSKYMAEAIELEKERDLLKTQVSELTKHYKDQYDVLEARRLENMQLKQQLAERDAEIERLKARRCSHGPYEMYGTDGCDGCDFGRIEMYRLNKFCLECQHKHAKPTDGPGNEGDL